VNKKAGLAAAALCLGAMSPAGVWAAPGSSLIIDQNRTDRNPPAPAPQKKAASPAGSAVNAAGPDIQPFTVTSVQLEGATIPAALVGPAFHPFIGQRLDSAGLTRLTQAAAAAYAKSNVALYTILLPNQTFAGGVVHLRVVEGYIAHVTVKDDGNAGKDVGLVRRYASRVLVEKPLQASTIQRSILLIRDIPGLKADVQFLRGAAPGAVDLAIDIKRRAFEIGVGVNDRGTAELGRTQVEVDLTANSLIRPGDQTRLTVAAPTDIQRFQYYALAHSELLNDDGLTLTGSIGYLRTLPKSIPIHGTAETAALSLSYPLIRSNSQNLSLTGSIDGVNSDDALFGQDISNDHTRALRVAAAYSHTFTHMSLAASATGSFGLDGLGAQVTSALLSDKTFKKVNGRIALDYRPVPQWTLRLRGIGQWTGDRLPAVEQLPLGGDEFGRAFESAAVVGDNGVAGSAEVGYAPKGLPRLIRGSEVYGYVDDGEVWLLDRVIIPKQSFDLASGGFGVRLAVTPKAVVQLEAAKALKDPIPGDSGKWRLVVSFRTAY
jgi:hemolysin activation/secretion protein